MATARIELPPKLIPVFEGEADVRGAYGGRGSAKTRSFAKMTAIRAYMWDAAGREGQILCARQFMNSLADSSFEEVKAAICSEPWLLEHFEIGEKYIRTVSGRVYYTFAGLDRNIDSVKSKARILLCWVDEAEPVSDDAWSVLIPTLREEDSELWVTWNPKRKTAPVEARFRGSADQRVKVAEINWRDNPWFPAILDRVRLRDEQDRPDSYGHIWDGQYVAIASGAYFADALNKAKADGRITTVPRDPILPVRAFFDLGGAGARADATAIWIAQFAGQNIHVLDYIEGQGQTTEYYVNELVRLGYGDAILTLPHDGTHTNDFTGKKREQHYRDAGFRSVVSVPNQGLGAAMKRIEAVRRISPRLWFNAAKTEAGRDALGWYHEKKDAARGVGLGPEHDWSSHAADAFGLLAIVWQEPKPQIERSIPRRPPISGGLGWMGG